MFLLERDLYHMRLRDLKACHKTASDLGRDACVRCGLCCKICPGRMSKENVEALALLKGMTVKELFRQYLTLDTHDNVLYSVLPIRGDMAHAAGDVISDEDTWSLSEPCVFYDATKSACQLHGTEAKPVECCSGLACKVNSAYADLVASLQWSAEELEEAFGIEL